MKINGKWFYDEKGRSILLRGVNLGGSSKTPYRPNGSTHNPFESDPKEVSFVGRPFPINQADEHYSRLRKWGFNCLRILTTWEALEHGGPGVYDVQYLDYLYEIVRKAQSYDFFVIIDPHQDMWSRFTGGDGAPLWTLEIVGFNHEYLDPSEAAITMQNRHPGARPISSLSNWVTPYPYSTMIWTNNRARLGCATMFTLFFAGNKFAPNVKVDGTQIQDFLQNHFIAAFKMLANRLSSLSNIVGYGSLNEPSKGYIEISNLGNALPIFNTGPVLTGLQSLSIPSGYTCEVPYQVRKGLDIENVGFSKMNPLGVSAWKTPADDVWRNHGVWDFDRRGVPCLLQPDYFADVNFTTDYLSPFIDKVAESILTIDTDALLFVEGQPDEIGKLNLKSDIPIVNASHWYDVLTLVTKQYNPVEAVDAFNRSKKILGESQVHESFKEQIGRLVQMSEFSLNGCPTLIGEFGLPYDLNNRLLYEADDDTLHIKALSSYYDAIDSNLVHSTQWNYTADHSTDWGDNWNEEDLSIFSYSKLAKEPNSDGGRAVKGFCRPYIRACAGKPIEQLFDYKNLVYSLRIIHNDSLNSYSEINIPYQWEIDKFEINLTSGNVIFDKYENCILWKATGLGEQSLSIYPKDKKKE